MKMIDGAASLAFANRSRTREAPTPTIASMNSEAEIEKNAACASPATARASSVLPVPGGPYSSTPWGIRPPRRTYRSGSRRKSTISVSSAFASSIPATSSKVTRIVSDRRAAPASARSCRARPGPAAGLRPTREQHEQADDQQRRPEAEQQLRQQRRSGFGSFALTWTPFPWSSAVSCGVVPERRDLRSRTASWAWRPCSPGG